MRMQNTGLNTERYLVQRFYQRNKLEHHDLRKRNQYVYERERERSSESIHLVNNFVESRKDVSECTSTTGFTFKTLEVSRLQ